MDSSRIFVALCIVAVAITGCSKRGGDSTAAEPEAAASTNASKATSVVDKLNTGDFAGVAAMFDETMTAALPVAALQQTWTTLIQQVGAFKGRGAERTTSEMGLEAVYVPCTFERATLNTKVVFDGEGRITGLFFQ
jgi:hypothetical protein